MGLRLKKYIELRENWAAENYRFHLQIVAINVMQQKESFALPGKGK